jgi:hypothetical protein
MHINRYRRLTALGLAHALRAGGREPAALLARAAQALGHERAPPWLAALIADAVPASQASWEKLTPADLAERLMRSEHFLEWLHVDEPPYIRRWLVRASSMKPAPLGLDGLMLPQIDHHLDLARWLGIEPDELGGYTEGAVWRRNRPLALQHYRFLLRPKRSGGGRLIEAPLSRLKALQTRVLHGLLDAVPVHEACHGFVAGRSVLTHARLHAGQPVLLQFDLRDFFSSITASRVIAIFETLGYPPGVARSLAALCSVQTPDAVIERLRDDGWVDWHQARRLRHAHLAQGAPSSPMLANLSAFSLDLRLDGLATALGARYSRYADDLVISGPATLAHVADRVAAWVGHIAADEGHAINHRKTRRATQAASQRVCGVVVNAHANLPRAEFDRLRALLHQCVLQGPTAQNREGHADFRAHLAGRVQWATQINPHKARRLHALWQRIEWPLAGAH